MAHNGVLEILPPLVGQSGLFACAETGHRLDVRGLLEAVACSGSYTKRLVARLTDGERFLLCITR